jgi:uncharacterized tellurite resistance protein B-like protein
MSAEPALQPHELLAFAGLARVLIRADGTFSAEEAAALEQVAEEFFAAKSGDAPYRQEAQTMPDPDAIWNLLDRAASELGDEEAVKRAAQAVQRPEARGAIYDALFHIASSDVVSGDEWPILDWLAAEWAVETSPEEGA